MPRLAIVSVHYYTHWCDASLRELSRIAALTSPSQCILVNNNPALLDRLIELSRKHDFVDAVQLHDNSGMEFGAYQFGLDNVLARGDFDWVLFVNDTFATHQAFCSRQRIALASRLNEGGAQEIPTAVGRVDSLARSYSMAGARSHRWIATNVFALDRKAISLLKGRVHHAHLDSLIRPVGDIDSFFASELDDALVRHLKAWLFGVGPGPRWGGAAPLTASNAARYAAKARSILQEKYLSALLEEGGSCFVDLRKTSDFDRVMCRAEQIVFEAKNSLRRRRAPEST